MLQSALLVLASATVALTTVACSSLTKPDPNGVKIYAEPLPGVVKPASPPVPAPAARGVVGGPQGAQARPVPAAAPAPANCGGWNPTSARRGARP